MNPKRSLYCTLLWLLLQELLTTNAQWTAVFDPDVVTIKMATSERVRVILLNLPQEIIERIDDRTFVRFVTENADVARVDNEDDIIFERTENADGTLSWETDIDVKGVFLGNEKQLKKCLISIIFIKRFFEDLRQNRLR